MLRREGAAIEAPGRWWPVGGAATQGSGLRRILTPPSRWRLRTHNRSTYHNARRAIETLVQVTLAQRVDHRDL